MNNTSEIIWSEPVPQQLPVLLIHPFAISAIIIVAFQSVFFLHTALLRLDRLKDCAGGISFATIALATLFQAQAKHYPKPESDFSLDAQEFDSEYGSSSSRNDTYQIRQVLVTIFVCAWAIRLSVYLLWRGWKTTKDNAEPANSPLACQQRWVQLVIFWTFQAVWVFTVSIPVIAINSPENAWPDALTDPDIMGVTMWAIGFTFEFFADIQKYRFRRRPSNDEKFCDDGLWTWSRHPNYFGEMMCWWGIFTMYSTLIVQSWMWLGVCSPLFVTVILLFLSGIPPLEQSADNRYGHDTEYQEYKYSTSPLIPMPPELYVKFPRFIQMLCLFELPLYDYLPEDAKPKDDDKPQPAARRFEMPY